MFAFLVESVFSFFFLFFLVAFLVESVFSFFFFFFLGRFLGRKRVFFFSYLLVFFFKFPPLLDRYVNRRYKNYDEKKMLRRYLHTKKNPFQIVSKKTFSANIFGFMS